MTETLPQSATVTVDVEALKAAFIKWNELAAAGGTLTPAEAALLPPDKLAQEQAEALFTYLTTKD